MPFMNNIESNSGDWKLVYKQEEVNLLRVMMQVFSNIN